MKESSLSPQTEPDTQLIYEFQREPHEKVCLTKHGYRGKPYFDLRIWFEDKENPTGFYPSKRGICLSMDFFPHLKAAVQQLEACVNSGGEQVPETGSPGISSGIKSGISGTVTPMPKAGYAKPSGGK